MALTDDIWLQSCVNELLDKNDKTFVLPECSQRCNMLSLQYIFIFLIPQNSVLFHFWIVAVMMITSDGAPSTAAHTLMPPSGLIMITLGSSQH